MAKDRFYLGAALAFLATALAGFGPSYYQKSHVAGALSPLLRVHAAVFMAWLVLLVVQTSLVAARRRAAHVMLGSFGVLLAASMLPLGWLTALEAARLRGGVFASPGLLMFQAGALLLFGAFVSVALVYRRTPDVHRRLMLLATVAIIPPAIARLPLVGPRPVLAVSLSLLFVLAGVLHDRVVRGRIHTAYAWGGLVLVLSLPARFGLAQTSAWQAFAHGLVDKGAESLALRNTQ